VLRFVGSKGRARRRERGAWAEYLKMKKQSKSSLHNRHIERLLRGESNWAGLLCLSLKIWVALPEIWRCETERDFWREAVFIPYRECRFI
jgi:hypothetical protein